MRGFKAFDKDLKCRDFQYTIGGEYEIDVNPVPCKQGFHFCESIADCYRYYPPTDTTRICEVESYGIVVEDIIGSLFCTNKIRIIKEIPLEDIKKNVNFGKSNTGYFNTGNNNRGTHNTGNFNSGNCNVGSNNTGNHNTGDFNDGYCNSGDSNTGNYNSGKRNTGDYNIGSFNVGNYNIGNFNTGNNNIGVCNSGDFNGGNNNAGIFCTQDNPTIKIFDKDSSWSYEDWRTSSAYNLLKSCPSDAEIKDIDEEDMTDEEKKYALINVIKEERQKWWDDLPEYDKQEIYDLPNFDPDKFYYCTGIRVDEEK